MVMQKCRTAGRIRAATCGYGRFPLFSGRSDFMTEHICRVATARIGYLGKQGQRVLDTTVKSGTGFGALFAPTWDMVRQFKQGSIDWTTYRQRYTELMQQRYSQHKDGFLEALNSQELVLCCYCPDTHATTRCCHRYLLVEILEQIAQHHGIGFEYMGEVQNTNAVSEYRLLIAGSRYATREAVDYARRVVRRAHGLGYTIVVGDNPNGVDMTVVQECRRLRAKVIVVGVTNSPRNGGCPQGSYLKFERGMYRSAGNGRFACYHERDRYMVDIAHRGVFVWNGDSKGTKLRYDYMVSRGREAHLITFERKGGRRHDQ
jgi:hypothetical protein